MESKRIEQVRNRLISENYKTKNWRLMAEKYDVSKGLLYNFVMYGDIPANESDQHKLGLIRDLDKKRKADRARRAARKAELERLRADNEHTEEALTKIRKWIQAYPVDIFPEPDMKQVRRLLEAGGIAIDCVSASNFRWLLNRLYEAVK